jgi:hypothetical protein
VIWVCDLALSGAGAGADCDAPAVAAKRQIAAAIAHARVVHLEFRCPAGACCLLVDCAKSSPFWFCGLLFQFCPK